MRLLAELQTFVIQFKNLSNELSPKENEKRGTICEGCTYPRTLQLRFAWLLNFGTIKVKKNR